MADIIVNNVNDDIMRRCAMTK